MGNLCPRSIDQPCATCCCLSRAVGDVGGEPGELPRDGERDDAWEAGTAAERGAGLPCAQGPQGGHPPGSEPPSPGPHCPLPLQCWPVSPRAPSRGLLHSRRWPSVAPAHPDEAQPAVLRACMSPRYPCPVQCRCPHRPQGGTGSVPCLARPRSAAQPPCLPCGLLGEGDVGSRAAGPAASGAVILRVLLGLVCRHMSAHESTRLHRCTAHTCSLWHAAAAAARDMAQCWQGC